MSKRFTRMQIARAAHPLLGLLVASTLALAPTGTAANTPSVNVAEQWNLNAVNAVRAARTLDGVPTGGTARPLYQTEGLLYMSYVQAAVYDATMKISHRYRLYHRFKAVAAGDASIDAAVVSAAYHTLVSYLGDASGTLANEYSLSLGALPQDKRTERGIAVGEAAAADIAALRADDGRNAPVPDACPPSPGAPGAYQCAPPPSVQALQTPWMASMKPFFLESTSAFRAPPPPALDSPTFLTNLAETKAFGAHDSTVRTADETAIALFWNLNAISQLNEALRNVAMQHDMDVVDTVRLLAMGDMVSTDAGMACFDSKYHYMFWRPITAIRATGDPTWSPLVTTPNHPEYPSQHGCVTSALVQAVATALGTDNINMTIPGGANPSGTVTTTRTFATVNDVMTQLVNARVWIGFHYRNSVLKGEALGTAAADWALSRNFQPTDSEASDNGDD